jgi:hypothetical protein
MLGGHGDWVCGVAGAASQWPLLPGSWGLGRRTAPPLHLYCSRFCFCIEQTLGDFPSLSFLPQNFSRWLPTRSTTTTCAKRVDTQPPPPADGARPPNCIVVPPPLEDSDLKMPDGYLAQLKDYSSLKDVEGLYLLEFASLQHLNLTHLQNQLAMLKSSIHMSGLR